MSTKTPKAADYGLLLLLGFLLACTYIFIKFALVEFDPMATIMLRLWLAAIILFCISLFMRDSFAVTKRDVFNVFLVGLTGQALPYLLIATAEEHVEPGMTSIFIGLMPIITLILAHFLTTDEKMNRYKFMGVIVAFCGLLVLIIPSLTHGTSGKLIPELMLIGAAFLSAVSSIITKHILNIPRRVAATILCFSAALSMTVFWSFTGQPINLNFQIESVLAIIALAIFSSVFTVLLSIEVLARQGASFSGQVNFVVPVISIVLAYIILQVQPSKTELIALCIILAGFAIARIQRPNL